MISEGKSSHSLNIPLKQPHEIGRALVELQEQIRKLTQEVAQVTKFTPWNPYHRGYDAHPIDIEYSSSYEDFDEKERRPRRLRHR